MDAPSHKKNYTVVPPEELRCIWMTAGIFSYQLCDRKFDCDTCPLDAALRKHRNAPAELHPAGTERETVQMKGRTEPLREELRYSANHCWMKQVDERRVRIGIEPGLAAALFVPKAVVLPSLGQRLKRQQICLWVVMEGGTFPLASPIDGDVVSVNKGPRDEPRELFLHPYENGWLFEVATEEVVVDALPPSDLMDASSATEIYGKETIRFREELFGALKGASPVGATLPDGGVLLHSISDMVGPKKYFQILKDIFGKPPSQM
jgi:glycine cleavage system H protein